MAQVWGSYTTDLGRVYPMFGVSISRGNDTPSDTNPLDLIPSAILAQLLEMPNGCTVGGLTPRQLSLFDRDGANFLISYPQPFSENLADYLTANPVVAAWEFIGERIKYGRLRRLLDNV